MKIYLKLLSLLYIMIIIFLCWRAGGAYADGEPIFQSIFWVCGSLGWFWVLINNVKRQFEHK